MYLSNKNPKTALFHQNIHEPAILAWFS